MESLALLPSIDELYDYRGSAGSAEGPYLWLPHHQGDVFAGVDIPGIDQDTERLAMLFMHPCTMRKGAVLKDHLTVIAVRRESPKKVLDEPQRWERRYAVMPLPDLLDTGHSTHVADFMAIGTVPSTALTRHRRIAALSQTGRLVLQQRVIYHLTRFAPKLDELREATSAVETELELQGDWVDAACGVCAGSGLDVAIATAETAFDTFMGQADRRQRLNDAATAAGVVIEMRQGIKNTYGMQ